MNLDEGGRCFCGKPSRRMTSWTDSNPGRRFYRCNNSEVSVFFFGLNTLTFYFFLCFERNFEFY